MPYDFAQGFNPSGGYGGGGFGGRQSGGRFANVFGYDDKGAPINSQQMQQTAPVQQPGPYVPNQPFAPPSQLDFFSQLAGLVGGGGPPQGMQGPQMNPWSAQQAQSQYSPGGPVNFGNFQSYAHQQGPVTGYGYSGGQGPYGGVNPEVQRAMFEGGNQMNRNGQMPSGNPLKSLPTIVSNHRDGGSSSFAPSTSVGSVSGRNNAPVGTMRAPTRVVNQNPYTPQQSQTPYGLPAGYSHGVRF
jgi:hypothetical protein